MKDGYYKIVKSDAAVETLLIRVYVIPKSNKSYLTLKEGELIFHSSVSCKNHGVNKDLLKWLSKHVGGKPVIIKGWSERVKIVAFRNIDSETALINLKKVLEGGLRIE